MNFGFCVVVLAVPLFPFSCRSRVVFFLSRQYIIPEEREREGYPSVDVKYTFVMPKKILSLSSRPKKANKPIYTRASSVPVQRQRGRRKRDGAEQDGVELLAIDIQFRLIANGFPSTPCLPTPDALLAYGTESGVKMLHMPRSLPSSECRQHPHPRLSVLL